MDDQEREIHLKNESVRGRKAFQIITDELYVECMKNLKDEIISKWAACPARDTDGREWLWQHYQVALRFENILADILETGKMADMSLKQNAVQKVVKKVVNYF